MAYVHLRVILHLSTSSTAFFMNWTSIQVREDVICISSIFFSVLTYKSLDSLADCSWLAQRL